MATAADITIAADGATFKLPEMTHNLPPTLAISALMTKVPRKAIAWLVYTLAEIDAKTALSLGIVSSVVPKAQLDARDGRRDQGDDLALVGGAGRGEGLSALGADDGAARRGGLWRGAAVGRADVSRGISAGDVHPERHDLVVDVVPDVGASQPWNPRSPHQ